MPFNILNVAKILTAMASYPCIFKKGCKIRLILVELTVALPVPIFIRIGT